MIRTCLLAAAVAAALAVPSAFAQAPACADIAGNYSGLFKGTTKVSLVVEPGCKLTVNGGATSGSGQAAIKAGLLVAKDQSYDLKLAPKDGKLVGEMSFGTTTDRNISFAK